MSFVPLDERFNSSTQLDSSHHARDLTNKPSAYDYVFDDKKNPTGSRMNPKNWTKRTWIITGLVAAAIIVAAVIGGVVGAIESKNNAYPDYTALSYSLTDTYSGEDFFDDFSFWSATDPADGFVIYVDEAGSEWLNLTYATSSSAVMKVDTTTNVDASNGRRSVRITSTNTYNSGLFIFDVIHAPYGCATWPALWLSDPYNWPDYGEIDVMEAVNTGATGNQMTLHTSDDCKMNVKRKETGTVDKTNCWNETNSNSGCGVKGKAATYGADFNDNGGGVYAMEWRSEGIRMWMFDRDSIPSDIDTSTSNSSTSSTTPDPSTWGEALADFPNTNCDIDSHFKNQSIIANIDLCGDWAGATSWYTDIAGCPGTCDNYVTNNGSAFTEAYWEFASFRVYTADS